MASPHRRKDPQDVRPPDWTAEFGRAAPLEVDLGCGRGTYCIQRATVAPQVNVLAMDTRKKWIERIQGQITRHGLGNLRSIRCDASTELPLMLAPGSVTGFTIQHPDPWWKKRHHKRRLVRPALLQTLTELLVPGGWVFVQTDVPDLADEIGLVFEEIPRFKALEAAPFKQNTLGGVMSHRERKCLELEIPIRRFAYRLEP